MLKDILNERNETIYNVSKKTGIPYSTLSDLVMEKTDIKNVQARQLYRLSKYLNLSMEYLYENKDDIKTIYLSNEGRNVILSLDGVNYQFLGPKNLVAFKHISKVEYNVIHVDTYYKDENGQIYLEEEYVDIVDVLNDYNISIPDKYVCKIKETKSNSKLRLIDESLLVSDSMALSYSIGSADDVQISVTNINRRNMFLKLRLSDYAILETNMSSNMQSRAIDAVKRNIGILEMMIKENRSKLYKGKL